MKNTIFHKKNFPKKVNDSHLANLLSASVSRRTGFSCVFAFDMLQSIEVYEDNPESQIV